MPDMKEVDEWKKGNRSYIRAYDRHYRKVQRLETLEALLTIAKMDRPSKERNVKVSELESKIRVLRNKMRAEGFKPRRASSNGKEGS